MIIFAQTQNGSTNHKNIDYVFLICNTRFSFIDITDFKCLFLNQ